MENEPKVFSSHITRSAKPLKNNLYDLLRKGFVQPVPQKRNEKRDYCDFQPRTDKHFEPKKKTKYKVRTVRDIRNSFEKDVYSTLPAELEKQQNVLLRKIRAGSSRDENTKTLAKNMLKCDKPISRSAWQMLMNINPEEYAHSTQFVLWNGRRIQVNGSKGGKFKFIYKYDLGAKKFPSKTSKITKRKLYHKRKGLLRNSLSVNFKPGPLTKKSFLDNSYQKYHVGGIEILDLPMPGLEINPTVGKTVDPAIVHFLNNMRHVDGTISKEWAEFSACVIAKIKDNNVILVDEENSVTFNLSYKSDQQRILMRRDINKDIDVKPLAQNYIEPIVDTEDVTLTSEIENLLDKMLDSVDISINQDNLFTGIDPPRDIETENSNSRSTNISVKDRLKRKCGELERLDVTIIRLSENPDVDPVNQCNKSHCSLGCVCASLECAYKLKTHCGRLECMFECKCDFSKYKVVDSFERDCSEFIPGLLNIDNEKYSNMAKEEQKFHQTVIVTAENSMLLKSKRRHWKSSKRYADFYSNMCLKTESKSDRVSEVVLAKLNLDNVEPWCMVHNLYKCFCKGKFTDHSIPEVIKDDTYNAAKTNEVITVAKENNAPTTENETRNIDTHSMKYGLKTLNQRTYRASKNLLLDKSNRSFQNTQKDPFFDVNFDEKSARTKPFKGRKYTDGYYLNANRKILEMEKHDKTLRNRMVQLINISASKSLPQDQNFENNSNESFTNENSNETGTVINANSNETVTNVNSNDTSVTNVNPDNTVRNVVMTRSKNAVIPVATSQKPTLSNINMFTKRNDKDNLVAWLETSYKNYRRRIDQGIVKVSLDPPKLGKMALYPWEFILSRYRDQKNLFLISRQPQYRIFMAVDARNPFFDNCININEIRFADLHKYPVTVKNLLTNAKDLKDNFCILCGLTSCWELIGSVTKICEQQEARKETETSADDEKHDFPSISTDVDEIDSEDSIAATSTIDTSTVEETIIDKVDSKNDKDTTSDSSKWFVMTVENDFDEIQFYNKGFFVKLESIIKAINVARSSGKTVRLSSQKCVDNTGPQFGIYAIPHKNESCVFVGPYEKDELLGIETVKKTIDIVKHRRTRGVWITTKKLENFNVIDNPLSFMPPRNAPTTEMMTLSGESIVGVKEVEVVSNSTKELPGQANKDSKPPGKPIKIRKTNGFYQLADWLALKKMSVQQIQLHNTTSVSSDNASQILSVPLTKTLDASRSLLNHCSPYLSGTLVPINKKPVAEIAPQVQKNTRSPGSISKMNNTSNKKERGMFILKPEEINQRLIQNQIPVSLESNDIHDSSVNTDNDREIEMDIENFLATAEECEAPNDDVLIISDDETDLGTTIEMKCWHDVWIQSKTVESLGWIPGRRNKEGLLSFEFPGFKFTEFYTTEDAYAKLNQVFSRKIYIPKNIKLEWHVVDSEQELGTKLMLKKEDLGPDFVLTKRGIRHKKDLSSLMKNGSTVTSVAHNSKTEEITETRDCIEDLEITSQLLEDERERLWNKLTNDSDNTEAMDNLREQIAARLQSMVSKT